MALDWVWAFSATHLAAGMCIALGVGIGLKYPVSRQASFARPNALGSGRYGPGARDAGVPGGALAAMRRAPAEGSARPGSHLRA